MSGEKLSTLSAVTHQASIDLAHGTPADLTWMLFQLWPVWALLSLIARLDHRRG